MEWLFSPFADGPFLALVRALVGALCILALYRLYKQRKTVRLPLKLGLWLVTLATVTSVLFRDRVQDLDLLNLTLNIGAGLVFFDLATEDT